MKDFPDIFSSFINYFNSSLSDNSLFERTKITKLLIKLESEVEVESQSVYCFISLSLLTK